MSNKKLSILFIVASLIVVSCGRNTTDEEKSLRVNINSDDSISDFDVDNESVIECVFDTNSHKFTSESLLKYDPNIQFTWDNENKKATTSLKNGDNLILSIGGCNQFKYFAELEVHIPLKDTKKLMDKTKWISSNFFNDGFQEIGDYISEYSYSLNTDLSSDTSQYFDIIISEDSPENMIFDKIVFKKKNNNSTIIKVGGYFD